MACGVRGAGRAECAGRWRGQVGGSVHHQDDEGHDEPDGDRGPHGDVQGNGPALARALDVGRHDGESSSRRASSRFATDAGAAARRREICAIGPGWSGVRAGTNLDVPGGMPDADVATCLAEYASRGPRYTSYPPATEFGPVAPELVERELTAIGDRGAPISLYAHV